MENQEQGENQQQGLPAEPDGEHLQTLMKEMTMKMDVPTYSDSWTSPTSEVSSKVTSPQRAKSCFELPPLHKWLLEHADEEERHVIDDAVLALLRYPERCPDAETVAKHLYGISKHFLAGIALARQLANANGGFDDKALHVAVAAAAAVHSARVD